MIAALASRYEGAVKDNINYTMDGTIDAVKFNDGLTDVLTNDDGTVQTEKVTVYPDKVNGSYNGYEIQRMVGKYYGMDFIPNIIVKAIVYLFFALLIMPLYGLISHEVAASEFDHKVNPFYFPERTRIGLYQPKKEK